MISAMPYATPLKPGSATLPLPGISAQIVRRDGTRAEPNEGGHLIIDKPWPGMLRNVWGNPERYKSTYFAGFPGAYEAGDGARVDDDGYFWIMGRLDDVINVSGHRMGTAEIESALVAHPDVSEAAVVGMPHDIKGETIYAYVTLRSGVEPDDDMVKDLKVWVRKEIGPIATPEFIQFADGLPKTRSGKIMRRVLRKIVEGSTDFGDTSTLADPGVVTDLVEGNKDLLG
jgi:acetyl-CoA synthetase